MKKVGDGRLCDEFNVLWPIGGPRTARFKGPLLGIMKETLDALADDDLLDPTILPLKSLDNPKGAVILGELTLDEI